MFLGVSKSGVFSMRTYKKERLFMKKIIILVTALVACTAQEVFGMKKIATAYNLCKKGVKKYSTEKGGKIEKWNEGVNDAFVSAAVGSCGVGWFGGNIYLSYVVGKCDGVYGGVLSGDEDLKRVGSGVMICINEVMLRADHIRFYPIGLYSVFHAGVYAIGYRQGKKIRNKRMEELAAEKLPEIQPLQEEIYFTFHPDEKK